MREERGREGSAWQPWQGECAATTMSVETLISSRLAKRKRRKRICRTHVIASERKSRQCCELRLVFFAILLVW